MPDPTISTRHLDFRCVQFDDSGRWNVVPMVYAQDFSSNGTTLIRKCPDEDGNMSDNSIIMGEQSGPALLIDGDRLQLSPAVSISFKESRSSMEDNLDVVMDRELEVCSRTRNHVAILLIAHIEF